MILFIIYCDLKESTGSGSLSVGEPKHVSVAAWLTEQAKPQEPWGFIEPFVHFKTLFCGRRHSLQFSDRSYLWFVGTKESWGGVCVSRLHQISRMEDQQFSRTLQALKTSQKDSLKGFHGDLWTESSEYLKHCERRLNRQLYRSSTATFMISTDVRKNLQNAAGRRTAGKTDPRTTAKYFLNVVR